MFLLTRVFENILARVKKEQFITEKVVNYWLREWHFDFWDEKFLQTTTAPPSHSLNSMLKY